MNFQVYKTFWAALPNEIVSEQDKRRNLANCMMNSQKQPIATVKFRLNNTISYRYFKQ